MPWKLAGVAFINLADRAEDGYDIRTVQEPLGQRDVSPSMILRRRSGQGYTHLLDRGGRGGNSPADRL